MRPFQGRGTSLALSGGVAPGYYLVPLQGTKKSPRALVSDTRNTSLPLRTPRMTPNGSEFVPYCLAGAATGVAVNVPPSIIVR
jgi:hypothetical protein